MGKSWFSAVKKALSPEAKERKQEKPRKAKKWFGKHKKLDPITSHQEDTLLSSATPPYANAPHAAPSPKRPPELAPMAVEDVKLTEVKDEQTRHAYSVALATAVAAEAAVAAAQAAAEVVRLTASTRFPGESREEIAAIKIQTAFRGYMARRALRALRGLVRLKTIIQGQSVRRHATSTLRCMQTLARVQYQIRERRQRLSEDKQARMRHLQEKHEKDLEKTGDNWDDSTLSKEQIEANMLNKYVAAMRRERALAYAFSHQQTWKNASKFGHQTFMDPNNPHWGWSWLERWMAARPCENPSATLDSADKNSVKSSASRAMSEIIPRSRNPSPKGRTPVQRRKATRVSSPRVSHTAGDDDSRSMLSIQSEQPCHRRHSICGSVSSARDDESITSCSQSQSVPSYMAPTQAAKARARFSTSLSPLGLEKMNGSAKKRLSFSGSPKTARRFSGPPKLESNGIKDIGGI